jgi:ATP-dependent RNA helicase SUPV3L1/SUV3
VPAAPPAGEAVVVETPAPTVAADDVQAPQSILPQADGPASAPAEPPALAAVQATTEVVAEEAQLVEVWRLGRQEGPRRHRRPPRARTRARPENLDQTQLPATADAASAPPGEAEPSGGEAAAQAPPRQDRNPRRHRQGRPDQNRLAQNRPDPNRSERADRPERHGRPERAGRGDRPDRDPELRAKYLKGRGEGRERRDKAPDPNSPFAKLAALKEQLEADAKERR